MYVRLLSGRYAGEERDIRADAARVMLEDGRAELPPWNRGVFIADSVDVTTFAQPAAKAVKRKKA